MKGYKAFNKDLTCRGFQYEIGKIYETKKDIGLCNFGFHFCKNIADCFNYYNGDDTRFAEVEALGEIVEGDDKCVTNKIRIIKEIPHDEAVRMNNTGNRNTGNRNTGNRNTGNWNTGNWNTGDWNTGDWNTGDRNTGDRNTGDWNTGDWNTSSFNNGCFMTIEPKIPLFNKPSDWTYLIWYNSRARAILNDMPQKIDLIDWVRESDMTDAEKAEYPSYKTTGGYIKVTKSNADKQKWWDELLEGDKAEVKSLPNFDAEIFKECTGIEVKE